MFSFASPSTPATPTPKSSRPGKTLSLAPLANSRFEFASCSDSTGVDNAKLKRIDILCYLYLFTFAAVALTMCVITRLVYVSRLNTEHISQKLVCQPTLVFSKVVWAGSCSHFLVLTYPKFCHSNERGLQFFLIALTQK